MADNAARKAPVPLTLVDDEDEEIVDMETFIVVGESPEDIAFEVCENLEIALDVREAMKEDGFTVRLYQATEIEVVDNEESGEAHS